MPYGQYEPDTEGSEPPERGQLRRDVEGIKVSMERIRVSLTGPDFPSKEDPPGLINDMRDLIRAVHGTDGSPGLLSRMKGVEDKLDRIDRARIATDAKFSMGRAVASTVGGAVVVGAWEVAKALLFPGKKP